MTATGKPHLAIIGAGEQATLQQSICRCHRLMLLNTSQASLVSPQHWWPWRVESLKSRSSPGTFPETRSRSVILLLGLEVSSERQGCFRCRRGDNRSPLAHHVSNAGKDKRLLGASDTLLYPVNPLKTAIPPEPCNSPAMDMETLPRFLSMSQDTSSIWDGCFLAIKQTEYFVEEKTAEEECLTEMPNVSPPAIGPPDATLPLYRSN